MNTFRPADAFRATTASAMGNPMLLKMKTENAQVDEYICIISDKGQQKPPCLIVRCDPTADRPLQIRPLQSLHWFSLTFVLIERNQVPPNTPICPMFNLEDTFLGLIAVKKMGRMPQHRGVDYIYLPIPEDTRDNLKRAREHHTKQNASRQIAQSQMQHMFNMLSVRITDPFARRGSACKYKAEATVDECIATHHCTLLIHPLENDAPPMEEQLRGMV